MMMMMPSIRDTSNTNATVGSIEDDDRCLSELTENALVITNAHEVTKLHTNNGVLTNRIPKRGLYGNGPLGMTANGEDSTTANESSESSDATSEACRVGPLGASSSLGLPQTSADVGLLSGSFPESWNDWELKRRSEFSHDNFWKRKKITKRKILDKKSRAKVPSVVSFRRRRLRLERSTGRHFRDRQLKRPCAIPTPLAPVQEEATTCTEIVPFQSSKSLRRRQRRRVVRFRDEEATLEWKRERIMGRGTAMAGTFKTREVPFLEAQRERKQAQRALLDLQVGMKGMGL